MVQTGRPNRVRVERTTSATVCGTLTVNDLRSVIDGLPGDARVSIKQHDATDQRDTTSTTITVHGVGV